MQQSDYRSPRGMGSSSAIAMGRGSFPQALAEGLCGRMQICEQAQREEPQPRLSQHRGQTPAAMSPGSFSVGINADPRKGVLTQGYRGSWRGKKQPC